MGINRPKHSIDMVPWAIHFDLFKDGSEQEFNGCCGNGHNQDTMDPGIRMLKLNDPAHADPGAEGLENSHGQPISQMDLIEPEEDSQAGNTVEEDHEQLDAVSASQRETGNQHQAGQQENANAGLDEPAVDADQEEGQ